MREFQKRLCGKKKGSRGNMRGYCNEKPAEMCLVPMKMGYTEERMGHCGLLKQVKLNYELL